MPKILHLRTVTGHGGGPEKTILNSQRFIGDDYQLQLAYIRPEGDAEYDLPDRAAQMGVPLIDIPERGPIDFRTVKRLSQLIRTSRPHILHAHDYKTNVLALMLGRWYRIPAITTVHGYGLLGGRLKWYSRIDRWALRRMDHVIVVSEDLYSTLTEWGVRRSRCSLVENAIDTTQYSRTMPAPEAKRRLGLDPQRLVIGSVGRLVGEKAFDLLILVVDRLLRRGLDVELLIIGEGEERRQLEALINRLGHTDRIKLLGYRADTLDLYQAMDVFVLNSRREAFPNVVLEALAMEVPVVATAVAGVPYIIESELNGLLVKPDDVEAMSASLTRLVCDAALRYRLAGAGRANVEERFSFEVRMQKVQQVYDRLLGREKPLSPSYESVSA